MRADTGRVRKNGEGSERRQIHPPTQRFRGLSVDKNKSRTRQAEKSSGAQKKYTDAKKMCTEGRLGKKIESKALYKQTAQRPVNSCPFYPSTQLNSHHLLTCQQSAAMRGHNSGGNYRGRATSYRGRGGYQPSHTRPPYQASITSGLHNRPVATATATATVPTLVDHTTETETIAEYGALAREVGSLTQQLSVMRDQLTKAKKERDMAVSGNIKLMKEKKDEATSAVKAVTNKVKKQKAEKRKRQMKNRQLRRMAARGDKEEPKKEPIPESGKGSEGGKELAGDKEEPIVGCDKETVTAPCDN